MKFPAKNFNGFTLLEVLIVMSILGALSVLFVGNFPSAQRRAKDVQRKSDLKQYNLALREFAGTHQGLYPGATSSIPAVSYCTAACYVGLCDYLGISSCPKDAKDGTNVCYSNRQCRYFYQSNNCNGGTACASSFVLRERLEGEDGWFIYCSNGQTGIVPETTDFNTSPGICPI